MKLIKRYQTGGIVDMTNVGQGAEKNPNYYIDNSMNPLPDVVITGDNSLNRNRTYRSSFNPNGAEEFLDATGVGLAYNPFRYTREMLNFDRNPKQAFNGALEASIPFSAPARAAYGAMNLADENGVRKTYNLLSNGQYGKAALSGVGDLFNAAMVGEGGRPILNNIAEGANNIERRGIETFMRTTLSIDPLPEAKIGINKMLKGYAGGLGRIAHISDYILRGKRVGPKGYYNSFANFIPNFTSKPSLTQKIQNFMHPKGVSTDYYTGFYDPTKNNFGKADMIDAYLYNKDIDTSFRLKKVATGQDFGVHEDYINQKYNNKKSNIPVYEVDDIETYPNSEVKPSNKWLSTFGVDNFGQRRPKVDVGGYLATDGITTSGIPVKMGQDIWKFNPEDYNQKYFAFTSPTDLKHQVIKFIINKGLKEVDRLGTPVVTRTKWTEKKNLGD